jgi:predicted nucleotide-binding protein
MSDLIDELLHIDSELRDFMEKSRRPEIIEPIEKLREVAEKIGKAWSGSWLGYQANVYYADLEPPPPGAHFSMEWGFQHLHSIPCTRGDWCEYDPDEVRRVIYEKAGNPDLKIAYEVEKEGRSRFDEKRNAIVSILETALATRQDPFINGLKEKVEKQKNYTARDFINHQSPSGTIISRDMIAMGQGFRAAPHIVVLSEVFSVQNPAAACEKLANIAKQAASHLKRIEKSTRRSEMKSKKVFIGHGGSPVWRELKDFIQDKLKLPCEEFNGVAAAGKTIVERLREMLDASSIAFLILTGEDEQTDGKFNPRMNVVHEAGLFQGRLGFSKAIILREDGCEEFSNIHGLVQIPFPKGRIKAVLQDVREVLEREGLIED